MRSFEFASSSTGDTGTNPGPPVTAGETELADLVPDLDHEHLIAAAARLAHERYPAGATIIREGDAADRFYILTEGEVEVVKEQAGAEPKLVATLSAGEYFGEIGILQGVRRTATVRASARSAVEVSSLDRETFLAVVRDADLTSAEISRLLRWRILATNLAVALPALSARRGERGLRALRARRRFAR